MEGGFWVLRRMEGFLGEWRVCSDVCSDEVIERGFWGGGRRF